MAGDRIELGGNVYSLDNAKEETKALVRLVAKAKQSLLDHREKFLEHNDQAALLKFSLEGMFKLLKADHLTADMLIKQEDLDQLEQQ